MTSPGPSALPLALPLGFRKVLTALGGLSSKMRFAGMSEKISTLRAGSHSGPSVNWCVSDTSCTAPIPAIGLG
jgi:hypothetical protein